MSLLSEPILKDRALVLRWFPVTDSSRVVVWFTSNYGKISTLIKGAQRRKSWMLGQYDLFYTCELLFYAKAKEDLHLIRECSPLQLRPGLRTDWRACAAASFIADVLYRISPPQAVAGEIYDLATQTLDVLANEGASPALLFWFELKVLEDLGVSPNLDATFSGPAVFDYASGHCRPAHEKEDIHTLPLSKGCQSLMKTLMKMDAHSKCSRLHLSLAQLREISMHLARFSEWHLDLRLPSRNRALELMIR